MSQPPNLLACNDLADPPRYILAVSGTSNKTKALGPAGLLAREFRVRGTHVLDSKGDKGGRYLGRQATRPGSAHPSRPPASEAPPRLSAYIGSPIGSHPDRLVGWPVGYPQWVPPAPPAPCIHAGYRHNIRRPAGQPGGRYYRTGPETAKSPPVRRALGVDSHLCLSMENYRPVSVRYHRVCICHSSH